MIDDTLQTFAVEIIDSMFKVVFADFMSQDNVSTQSNIILLENS